MEQRRELSVCLLLQQEKCAPKRHSSRRSSCQCDRVSYRACRLDQQRMACNCIVLYNRYVSSQLANCIAHQQQQETLPDKKRVEQYAERPHVACFIIALLLQHFGRYVGSRVARRHEKAISGTHLLGKAKIANANRRCTCTRIGVQNVRRFQISVYNLGSENCVEAALKQTKCRAEKHLHARR